MHIRRLLIALVLFLSLAAPLRAQPELPAVFGDRMVLQRGMPVPVWGQAQPNEEVTVSLAGQQATTTAGADGAWLLRLPALGAGGPHEMTVRGSQSGDRTFGDVLVGDVWICSGQSNMQWPVGRSMDAEEEIAAANFPQIRLFTVGPNPSIEPTRELGGDWQVCSPETVRNFSAVGYFFGQKIHQAQDVPVGLIDNAWGGMPAETYTSERTLASDPDFQPILARKTRSAEGLEQALAEYRQKVLAWQASIPARPTPDDEADAAPDADDSDWPTMSVPGNWERAMEGFDGGAWLRRTVDVPADWARRELRLQLGAIDDFDVTFVNGVRVGSTGPDQPDHWRLPRDYRVPADAVRPGRNVIAIYVVDWGGNGGLMGPAEAMRLAPAEPKEGEEAIALTGDWRYRAVEKIDAAAFAEQMRNRPREPLGPRSPSAASNLFNGMVHPLIPYAIRGVIWYQGESNAARAEQYVELFPAMIADWRRHWGQGDFPFLFVQLANFRERQDQPGESGWAELREAQRLALETPNTGMAVAIDIGEADDIHPRNKQEVGRRLALAARTLVYGDDVVHSGPTLREAEVEGDAIRLAFDNVGSGLAIRDGDKLEGFAIAGEDRQWRWADARIEGDDTVVVSSPEVANPVAVRYGWADNPATNLINREGLPASPFRTDDWAWITAGRQ